MLSNPSRPFAVQIILTPPDEADLQLHVIDPGSEVVTVQLSGELDASNSAFVAAVLDRRIAGGTRTLRLDLSRLDFCDWAGIGVLVWAHNRMRGRNGELVLSGVGTSVARLLSVSRLDQSLCAIDDEERS